MPDLAAICAECDELVTGPDVLPHLRSHGQLAHEWRGRTWPDGQPVLIDTAWRDLATRVLGYPDADG